MKRWELCLLLLAASACDAGGPTEPEGTSVRIRLANPTDVERPEPLRLAVVWRTDPASGTAWVTTYDHALSATEESHPVRVELPRGVNLAALTDTIGIAVQCAGLEGSPSWPGAIPLWVAYQDVDQDQRLKGDGADRVVAMTHLGMEHLAAFMDLEAVLSELSFQEAECLRGFTGGAFSPFVSGRGSQTFFANPAPVSEFTLYLSPTQYPAAFLACGRALTWSEPQVDNPPLLSVALGLVPEACAEGDATCTRVAFADDWRDVIEPVSVPGYHRSPECVLAGELEVLWVREEVDECAGCSCVPHLQDRGWVVSRDTAPSDWPCGTSVPRCATVSNQVEVIPIDCPM